MSTELQPLSSNRKHSLRKRSRHHKQRQIAKGACLHTLAQLHDNPGKIDPERALEPPNWNPEQCQRRSSEQPPARLSAK